MLKLGFIGTGITGTALALRLYERGYPIMAVSSLTHTSAEKLAQTIHKCRAVNNNQTVADNAELIFVTTPDDIITRVVAEVKWRPGQSIVHCSGADSTAILEPARKLGARVGAFHPLQTFASAQQALENLPTSTFSVEAEEPLLTTLKDMAITLDGHWITLKASDKVIYHAAAVITCNYLVTLVKLSTDLWQTFGVPPQEATRALLPLLRGTIRNIETIGIPRCLTGPIARGDTGTIKKHLDTLEKIDQELLSTYRELGRQTIPIALDKGRINQQQAEKLKSLLDKPSLVGSKGEG
ncbi:MAG: F420-dependent NADP oxidoreductase [Dehalococcoidales bacterium]|nr:F420-dependent NADP oxidoreductase [Dehalococcoidales bacterium]MDP6221599.1 DUF2520 domain-containing protein [Dehalococcoidales bacterium]MDP7109901.1 DUF2520 domain-containing protein [Dehalococcoidales bacterium]MDP7309817.1 DUF2520 domain-containing protein [Dehalococcoidales bacterium]MDP7409777.1 DUF2520 domain-containing protein [Dehalococcoidales bacterium]